MRAWSVGAVAMVVAVSAAWVPTDRAPRARVGPAAAPAEVIYAPPVTGSLRVVRPFEAPATPYGPGHRGVDLAAAAGSSIRAAGDGTVIFAGPVAGRGVVVLAHPDGISTEYEPVRPLVVRGARVRRGDVVAVLIGRHPGCRAACLHWGARRSGAYLDPLILLRPLGPVVLLPWPRDGTAPL